MKVWILALIIICSFYATMAYEGSHRVINTIMDNMMSLPTKDSFKAFHYLYQRPYELNSEEGLKKYRVYKSNLKFIQEVNSKNLGYTLGVNMFADLTVEEYASKYLGNKQNEMSQLKEFDDYELRDENEADSNDVKISPQISINHLPFLSKPKEQGECGCCWAFAILGVVEANLRKNYGLNLNFSVQSLVSCDPKNDCTGGNPLSAIEYLKQNGVAHDLAYPYVSGSTKQKEECKINIPRNKIVQNYEYSRDRKEYFDLLQKGPLRVSFDASSKEFMLYRGGILDLNCKEANHAMIAYGYGSELGKNFHALRNSHGERYGEDGNLRFLDKGEYQCFIEKYAFSVEVHNKGLVPEPDPPKKCLQLYEECNRSGSVTETCTSLKTTSFKNGAKSLDEGKSGQQKIAYFTLENCLSDVFKVGPNENMCIPTPIKSVYIEDEQYPQDGCVWVFDERCLTGNKLLVCSDQEFTDFKVSSVKLPKKGILLITLLNDKNLTKTYITHAYGLSGLYAGKVKKITLKK